MTIENKLGKKHELRQSDDPGRYLCNYIYFKSSHELSLKNENVCSLFVHFPDLKTSPHEKNVAFVDQLLHLLLKSK